MKIPLIINRPFVQKKLRFLRPLWVGKIVAPVIEPVEIPVQVTPLSKSKILYQKIINKDLTTQKDVKKITPTASPEKEAHPPKPVVKTQAPQSKMLNVNSRPKTRRARSLRSIAFGGFVSLSMLILLALFAPVAYFRFFNHETVPVKTTDVGTPLGGEFEQPQPEAPKIALPEYDESLPEGSWLIIPRIGVRTEILESANPEQSLVKGVWRVPEFGKPGELAQPMIMAAHRFGYTWWWKGEYWRYHSFYLLPDLEPGDLVEVISEKRKYVYEIYSGEEGTEISDYDAHLILYTCKYLTSEIRHFRYARLIDPAKFDNQDLTSI